MDKYNFSYESYSKICDNFTFNVNASLYNFFISEGLLNPLSDIDSFIYKQNSFLSKINDPNLAKILKNYSEYLICKKRNLIKRGWNNRFAVNTFYSYTKICFLFLSFISEYKISIHETTDLIVDKFLSTHSWANQGLRHFIKWLNLNCKLYKKLSIPNWTKCKPINPYSSEDTLKILELLSFTHISNRDRLMCLLLILYGIRSFELSQLKISNFRTVNESYILNIRNASIPLHPLIIDIYKSYLNYERSSRLSLGNNGDWLFFGSRYNKPLTANQINKVLRKYNIDSRRSFSTAICNTLSICEIPSILIKGLGISINTAMKYYKELSIDSILELNYNNQDSDINFHDKKIQYYFVYILRCNDSSYYTGYTSNLTKRIEAHQSGKGCNYTKSRTPVELVYQKEYIDKSSALKDEKRIKKLTIFEKEQLIQKSRVN